MGIGVINFKKVEQSNEVRCLTSFNQQKYSFVCQNKLNFFCKDDISYQTSINEQHYELQNNTSYLHRNFYLINNTMQRDSQNLRREEVYNKY